MDAPFDKWSSLNDNGITDFELDFEVHLARWSGSGNSATIHEGFIWGYTAVQLEKPKSPEPPLRGGGSGGGGGGGGAGSRGVVNASTPVVGSFDPNDKTGPTGYGITHFIAPDMLMPFTVYYENDPELGATAPAQIVQIDDELDANLDLTTFELGDINLYGDFWIDVPEGLNYYETLVDLRPEGNELLVRVTAGLDSGDGMVTWLFESLDPETMEPPDDPMAGFLPVNDPNLHDGEGHLTYTIRPLAGLVSGAEITNQALNTFDTNDPVATPTTLNTIDAGLPTSAVDPLPSPVPDAPFTISWSGNDDPNGSGIATYTIEVKRDDDQVWWVWLKDTPDTSAEFSGVGGHRYGFRAVATDQVGYVEDDPGVEEAWTRIDFSQLTVDYLEATPRGFVAHFLRELDDSVLSLYDVEEAIYGPADVTVVGDTVGPVAGSLVYDAAAKTVTFLKSGGPLVPNTYTITLRSADDAFKDAEDHLLDGDGDGVEGGNYVATVTVEPTTARLLSMPDFTRGPGQAVDVPATGVGLPISIDDGANVKWIDLTFTYDPESLDITGASVGSDLPAGSSQVAVNLSVSGQVTLSFYTLGTLEAGLNEIVVLSAKVPTSASYGAAHVLDITNVSINDGELLAAGQDAIHVAAFFGDATRNQQYSAGDARAVARIEVDLDEGFEHYPMVDPVVIADISGSGALSGLDASHILEEAVGLDCPLIPPLPGVNPAPPADSGSPADAPTAVAGAFVQTPATLIAVIQDLGGIGDLRQVGPVDTPQMDGNQIGEEAVKDVPAWAYDLSWVEAASRARDNDSRTDSKEEKAIGLVLCQSWIDG